MNQIWFKNIFQKPERDQAFKNLQPQQAAAAIRLCSPPLPLLPKNDLKGILSTPAQSGMQQRKKAVHAHPDIHPANTSLSSGGGDSSGSSSVQPASISSTLLNSFFPIFFILLVPRFIAANRAPISDCDETFNFWEAVHHMTFRGGQQTWEHAPQYALRSWLYAGAHALLFQTFGLLLPWTSPANFWFLCRFVLAAMSASVEAFAAAVFLRSCRQYGQTASGYLAVLFLATSPGLFNHQISLLPTTTAATLLLLCTALTLFDHIYFSHVPLLAGIAILLGWPFACVAYAPMLLSTLHFLGLKRALSRASVAACTIMAASVACDSCM